MPPRRSRPRLMRAWTLFFTQAGHFTPTMDSRLGHTTMKAQAPSRRISVSFVYHQRLIASALLGLGMDGDRPRRAADARGADRSKAGIEGRSSLRACAEG